MTNMCRMWLAMVAFVFMISSVSSLKCKLGTTFKVDGSDCLGYFDRDDSIANADCSIFEPYFVVDGCISYSHKQTFNHGACTIEMVSMTCSTTDIGCVEYANYTGSVFYYFSYYLSYSGNGADPPEGFMCEVCCADNCNPKHRDDMMGGQGACRASGASKAVPAMAFFVVLARVLVQSLST
mmetsp:Transcript_65068/g.121237  ORF Transcript_65068/g.121237 Transcript_65068/m.121237 type:complete len:181 (-) Transcript_65068:49-591(-)